MNNHLPVLLCRSKQGRVQFGELALHMRKLTLPRSRTLQQYADVTYWVDRVCTGLGVSFLKGRASMGPPGLVLERIIQLLLPAKTNTRNNDLLVTNNVHRK